MAAKSRWRSRAVWALCAAAGACASQRAQADLYIYHLDVGMGDSTLFVDSDTDRTLLVDSGNVGQGAKAVGPALKILGYDKLDYLVVTHYDADHIGGIPELVDDPVTTIETVFDRGAYTDRSTTTASGKPSVYGSYLAAAARLGTRQTPTPSCQPAFQLSDKTTVQVVAAAGSYVDAQCGLRKKSIAKSEDNDLSIALIVRHGDFSYFIAGDLTGGGNSTKDMESLIAHSVGDVDVLKLSHHGSNTSSNSRFLSVLSPEVVVVSVGNGGVNKTYKLPSQHTLDRVAELIPPPQVFLTHEGEGGSYDDGLIVDGHIVLQTNGTSYSVNGRLYPTDERREALGLAPDH